MTGSSWNAYWTKDNKARRRQVLCCGEENISRLFWEGSQALWLGANQSAPSGSCATADLVYVIFRMRVQVVRVRATRQHHMIQISINTGRRARLLH